jgi:hypothetical protein
MVNSSLGVGDLPTRVTHNSREEYAYPIPKSERAPATPLAVGNENIQERLEVRANAAQDMALTAAGDKLAGHVDRFVMPESVSAIGLVPRGTELEREAVQCVETARADAKPVALAAQTSAVEVYGVSENVPTGAPQAAGDKLEGYVPRFFLKEDGKHDDT